MLKNFKIYSVIGIFNTGLHWIIFFLCGSLGLLQAYSNLVAFTIASTFSYFMNSTFNFKKKVNGGGYFLFILGLGSISFLIGALADTFLINKIITLAIFSGVSLILGFIYSKYIVFK